MDHREQTIDAHIEAALQALRRNGMDACFVPSAEAARELVRGLLHEGDTVSHGGSMTLEQTGILAMLREGPYHFLDRSAPGITPEGVREVYLQSFRADAYLLSANAVTERGELYNVDGNSNRMAAFLYGPKSVIVVAGVNKLVPDLDAARERVRAAAAPLNAKRLGRSTPCVITGHCMDCASPDRICCNTVVSAQQRERGRVKVILVGETLGY